MRDHEAELQGLRASMSAAQAQTAEVQKERDSQTEQSLQAQEQQLQVGMILQHCRIRFE